MHWLGLHRRLVELPEAAVEVDLGLSPAGSHQRNPLVETSDERVRVNAEGSKLTPASPGAEPDLHPSVAQAVERADALRQVKRAVQWADEDRAAQSQPLAAGGRVGHGLERAQHSPRPQDLLLRPGAFESELLDSGHVAAEPDRIETIGPGVLGDRDREAYGLNPVRTSAPAAAHQTPG